jgi:hypothetical protein
MSTLLITLVGVSAQAQNKPLACQDDAVGGLNWENRSWATSTFKTEKFILVQAGNTLTKESVAKVLNTPMPITCNSYKGERISCAADFQFLLFNIKTLKGGISHMLGATTPDGVYKDSVVVQAFSCQPF